jgi:hypothetical protein
LACAEENAQILASGQPLVSRSPYCVESGRWHHEFLCSRVNTVEVGTSEIQRNIIAERVLGLPQDVRVDKDVPFREIPTGSRA